MKGITKNIREHIFPISIFISLILLYIFYSAVIPIKKVQAASVSWTGGSGDWETGSNWSGGSAPDQDDEVTIDLTVTVNINASTTINSLTLGGSNSPTLNFDYDAIGSGALILDEGNLIVYSGANITHTAGTGSVVGIISIDVQTGNLILNGTINVNGKGYQPGAGTGAGGGGWWGGAGAGHGARGGSHRGDSLTPGGVYGSMTQPITIGSGGGNGDCSAPGGRGGGAVRLNVGGYLDVSGDITANGNTGTSGGCPSYGGGGGSGGSIYITAAYLSGGSSMTADGANGGNGGAGTAGGGGGGRIAIYYTNSGSHTYSGTITVAKGVNGCNASCSYASYGSTYYLYDGTGTDDDLFFVTNSSFDAGTYTLRSVTISSGVTVDALTSSGTNLVINGTGNFTLPNTSFLSANGRGYGTASGTGPGIGTWNGGGGGGHGGVGGNDGGTGGGTYGSATQPITPGSGGGTASCSGTGAAGGGAIKLNFPSGTVDISGDVTADGNNGTPQTGCGGRGGGGGAGGSVWVIAYTLIGSGNLIADGGDGGNGGSGNGGGGGGGRIALIYSTSTLSVSTSVAGGTISGGDGTVSTAAMPSSSVSDLSGHGDIYAGKTLDITAVYSDGDGASTLDDLHLRIQNPGGTDIEYYGIEGADSSGLVPTNVTGAAYVTSIIYDRDTSNPTANDITLTWHITFDWDWTENSNIEYGVKATDDDANDSGWDYTDDNYTYENDLDFTGTLTATRTVNGSLASGDWVQGGETITWSGLKVVYEGTTTQYPPDSAFDVRVSDDDGSTWDDTTSSGANFSVVSTADAATDTEDIHNVDIIGIPTDGSDVSSNTFTIKVDASTPNIVDVTGDNENTWQNDDSGPTISWTDPASPSDDTFYITNDGSTPTSSNYQYTTTSNSYDLPAQGAGITNIKVRPLNGAEKYGTTHTFTIKFDDDAPANVSSLTVTALSTTSLQLAWENPSDSDFDHVVVVRKEGSYPTNPTDGTEVYSGSEEVFNDEGLTAATEYYYAVFAYDSNGNYSSGAVIKGVTDSETGGDVDTDTLLDEFLDTEDDEEEDEEEEDEDKDKDKDSEKEKDKNPIIELDGEEFEMNEDFELHVFGDETIEMKIPVLMLLDGKEGLTIKSVVIIVGDNVYIMTIDEERKYYTSKFKIPQAKGTYDLQVVATYSNGSAKKFDLGMTVDPYGYVYTIVDGNELHLKGAEVTLSKKVDGKEVLWESKTGTYQNPQLTNEQGEYKFFVEDGTYKLLVRLEGYKEKHTDWFEVKDNTILLNIQLEKESRFQLVYCLIPVIALVLIVVLVPVIGPIVLKTKKSV